MGDEYTKGIVLAAVVADPSCVSRTSKLSGSDGGPGSIDESSWKC